MKTLACILFLTLDALAHGVDLTFAWDANPPEDEVRGYNLYRRVSETARTKLNPELILGTRYTAAVEPGWSLVVRAVNDLGESEDSNVLTLPLAVPKPPAGLKTVIVEQSSNLTDWSALAVLPAKGRMFFRVRF